MEIVLKAVPTESASWVISTAAVSNAIVSSRELLASAIAEDDLVSIFTMSALDVAAVLPIILIFDITPSSTSSTSTSYAFIIDTKPSVAVSTSIPGEIAANCEESFAIDSAASLELYPNLDQAEA